MPVAQSLSALIFVFLGFCFGFFLDLYRVIRRLSAPGPLLTAITDLLFWVTYTIWVYIALLKLNSGEVRFYLLLSIAIGAGCYYYWFSRRLMQAWYYVLFRLVTVAERIVETINVVIETSMRMILWPYRVLETYLLRPIFIVLAWLLSPLLALFNYVNGLRKKATQGAANRGKALVRSMRQALAKLLAPPPIDE